MDQKINQYLDNLVKEVLASPGFTSLPEDQRIPLSEKIRTYLDGVIIDVIVDNLNEEQLSSLKDLSADSPQMKEKIEEYASQIPFLAEQLEQELQKVVTDLKQNPQKLN